MFKTIEPILKQKTDEVMFIELKQDIDLNGLQLKKAVPLPMPTKDLKEKIETGKADQIKIDAIINGMIKVIGIDSQFKYKKEYVDFLKEFDPEIDEKITKNGVILASNEKLLEAVIHFKAAYELTGDDLNILFNYARACDNLSEIKSDDESNKFFLEANKVFKKIEQLYPDFADTYYFLGFHYAIENSYVKAKQYFKVAIDKGLDEDKKMKVIEIMKDIDDKVTFEKGYKLILNDRVQEGLEKLLSLEEFHSDWWKLLFFIGLAYRKLEEYDKAIEYYRKTLEYNNSHVETMNELGICYLSNKEYNLAEETFRDALKHDQNNHELLCNLGIVYLNTGKIEMAREKLYKAKEIKPDDEIVNAWINQLNQM